MPENRYLYFVVLLWLDAGYTLFLPVINRCHFSLAFQRHQATCSNLERTRAHFVERQCYRAYLRANRIRHAYVIDKAEARTVDRAV